MNTVERLSDETTCDQCCREIPTGELLVTGYVEVPISCDGTTDWVPVIGMCGRCAQIPNGFQDGWDLYRVSEWDLLRFADDNLREAAAQRPGDPEVTSAMRSMENVRSYLFALLDDGHEERQTAA